MNELEKALYLLKAAIEDAPHPALIYAARYLLGEYDRDTLPDWVAALANGNAATFEDLADVVRDDMTHGGDK